MFNINFVSLCESVLIELSLLKEASRTNLADIARQAASFRKIQKQTSNKEIKDNATKQLEVLRSFVVDEINAGLPEEKSKKTDKEIDQEIYKLAAKSNHELEGLLNLLNNLLPQKVNLSLNYRRLQK